jgi:hypothetical protein
MNILLLFKSIVSNWKLYISLIAVAAAAFFVWQYKNMQLEVEQYKTKITALNSQLVDAAAQVESAKNNVKIVTKVVTKREYYRLKGNDIVQYVDREIVKYDNSCVIPKEFTDAVNKAATK